MTTSAPSGLIELPPWHTENWDTAVVEGVTIPGLVMVGKIKRGPKWDRKAVKGQSFENQTFGGWNGAAFEIRVRTWTRAQHEEFVSTVLPVIEPTPGKDAPKQLSFFHPQAAARKVDIILVDDVDGPEVDEDGAFSEWVLTVFESRKPVPAPKGGGGKPAPPGSTPCQEARMNFDKFNADAGFLEQQIAALNVAIIAGDATLSDVAERDRLGAELQTVRESAQAMARFMEENSCSAESSPASEAAANGEPDP